MGTCVISRGAGCLVLVFFDVLLFLAQLPHSFLDARMDLVRTLLESSAFSVGE